jgi:hypothetical protein
MLTAYRDVWEKPSPVFQKMHRVSLLGTQTTKQKKKIVKSELKFFLAQISRRQFPNKNLT